MKTRWALALALVLGSTISVKPGIAAETVAGGVEFSGNITVVTGWQHDDGSTLDPTGSCAYGIGGLGCNSIDTAGSGGGQLGDFRGLGAPNRDTFNFYLDQVELDVQKSFGENIRIRGDLDFGRFLSGSGPTTGPFSNFMVEQAYITANIPMGPGLEFLAGRFNAPIGLESVDRPDNIAISFSNIYRYLRPHNLTGVKLYIPFNDTFDWSIYIVNNLSDTFSFASGTDSAIPSYGTRFGFTWGEEGKESTVGLSYAGGPEQFATNGNLTHIIDMDFMIQVVDSFAIGGEFIYRQDNITPAFRTLGFTKNSKGLGGFAIFAFNPTETWDFWFRYGYIHDIDPTAAYSGMDQQIHDFTVGAAYQITDGAKMKFEYRLDLHLYAPAQFFVPGVIADTSSISNAFSAEFAYNF